MYNNLAIILAQLRAFRVKKLTTEEFEEEEVPFSVKGTQRVGSLQLISQNGPWDGLVTWESHTLFPLSS